MKNLYMTNYNDDLKGVYELRTDIFCNKFGWEIPLKDGLDIDDFDKPGTFYGVLEENDKVVGCFRAIRTTDDYLLEKNFDCLGCMPKDPNKWEISRFAVSWDDGKSKVKEHTYDLFSMMHLWFEMQGADEAICVTEGIFERLVNNIGVKTVRHTNPIVVGKSKRGDVQAFAARMPIIDDNAETLKTHEFKVFKNRATNSIHFER